MALPALIPTPKPPPRREPDYTGIERLDRPELDDVPDTDRDGQLPPLDWEDDGDSGVKRRHP